MSQPTVSFKNNLSFVVRVYDSFSESDKSNYFGTLTLLVTVPANTTVSIQPIREISTLIVSNAVTNTPLARLICSQLFSTEPFGVGPADVDAMAQTMDFITFITHNPKDPLTTAFLALLKDKSKSPVKSIDHFFTQQSSYANCTFVTYMMGITYVAKLPVNKDKPLNESPYSLSSLTKLLGGGWPDDLPDIVVTNFTCTTRNDTLAILAEIDLKLLPAQSDQALQFFGSLFDVQKLYVMLDFKYGIGLDWLSTRLSISLDAVHVPCGDSKSLTINRPSITIDISPIFKFVVFTVAGSIPFDIFGKVFEADVSMVIDNMEASFGVVIKGDHASLPTPPGMKGVYFDEFGVGMGVFFEPPGAVIGLSGKVGIGDAGSGHQVALDDNTFVVVYELVEEVPNPLYISFYVPQMVLADVLTVFTNAQTALDVPVSFTDLSFKWIENPMEPVVLPDGSLSDMAYGFSAAADILSFSFYGDVEINLTDGLKADIEMGPLALGTVFSLEGDGTGVFIKVDASGNPIKNNQLRTKAAQQQALKDATTKQLVTRGGPVLKLQTFASPFLHLSGRVSLFEVEKAQLNADITKHGITFKLDFGGVLESLMSCTLADFHNLAAEFDFGINQTISLPLISGVSLGSLTLAVTVNTHFTLSTSLSDLILQVGGSFDFFDVTRNFGDFTVDAHIPKVTDLLSAIISYIEKKAKQIFSDLLDTGAAWVSQVRQEWITAVDSVPNVLRVVYGQNPNQIARTMSEAGYEGDEIARQLLTIFHPFEIANILKDGLGLTALEISRNMQQAGCTGQQVAEVLTAAFGRDAAVIGPALKDAYGWSDGQVHDVLITIGFATSEIRRVFPSLGGDLARIGSVTIVVRHETEDPNDSTEDG